MNRPEMHPIGRTPTMCCGCFSRNTRRTCMGTYYCDSCRASAREFVRKKRERGGALLAATP